MSSKERDPLILNDATLATRYALLLAAGIFLVAGLAGGGPLVTWLGLFIVFTCLIAFSVNYLAVRSLKLKRLMPTNRAFENALAQSEVRVSNLSPFSCLLCQVEDRFPPAGRERHLISVSKPLLGNRQYTIPLEFICHGKRGKYTVGPVRLIVHDLFGLYTLASVDEQRHEFYVYPPPFQVVEFPFQGEAQSFTFGQFVSSRLGAGMEFASVREFRERDQTRDIHWQATARRGQLMVKEFDQTGAVQVNLFFDLSRASLCGIGRHSTSEYAIKIAASLAKMAIEEGHQVQMLAEGERLVYVPLGTGMWHLTALMQELAQVRVMGRRPLYELIDQYVELVPPNSSAIVVFSKCDIDIDHYLEAIRLLRSQNVQVTAVIIDHTTFLPVFETHNYGQARRAHEILMQQGVTVYWVRQGDKLAQSLSLPAITPEAIA